MFGPRGVRKDEICLQNFYFVTTYNFTNLSDILEFMETKSMRAVSSCSNDVVGLGEILWGEEKAG